MADQTLKLSLLLDLTNQASPGIKTFIADLQKLDKQGALTLGTLKKIRTELARKMGGSFGSGAISMLQRMRRESDLTGRSLDTVRNKLNRPMRTGGNTAGVNAKLPILPAQQADVPRTPQRMTGLQRISQFNDRYVDPGLQITQAIRTGFRDAADMTKPYTDAAMALSRSQAQFKIMGFSEEENRRAFKVVADNAPKQITTKAAGTDIMTDLVNTVGSIEKAAQVYDIASKYSFNAQAVYGQTTEQASQSIQTGFKAIEVMGRTGPEEARRTFDLISKVSASSGGRITGEDFLQFARKGGPNAKNLSDKGLINMSTLFAEMGASQVGTALTSLLQNLNGGALAQRKMQRWDELGMLDQSKITRNKTTGVVNRMAPGALIDAELLQTDPLAFAEKIRANVERITGKKFEYDQQGNMTEESAKRMDLELKGMLGNRTSERALNNLLTQRGSILKESLLTEQAMGIEKMHQMALEEQAGKALKFEIAWTNFKADAGGPVLEFLTSLMQTAQPLLKILGDYPGVTSKVVLGLAGLRIASSITESFSILNRALSASDLALQSTGTTAAATAKKVGGIRGQLASMPRLVQVGISLAALDFTWEMIKWLRETAAKETDQTMANSSANKQAADLRKMQIDESKKFESPEAQKQYYRSLGMSEPVIADAMPNARRDASKLADNLNDGKRKELTKSLIPSRKEPLDVVRDFGRFFTNKSTDFQTIGPIPADIASKQKERKAFYESQGSRSAPNTAIDYLVSGLVPALAPVLLNKTTSADTLVNREQRGAAFFREQAPQLQDPALMQAFRTQEVPKMKLGEQGTADLNNMLKLAFPESFAASSQAVAGSFQQMVAPIASAATGLTSMYDPLIQTGGAFMALSPTVEPLPTSFANLSPQVDANQQSMLGLYNASRPVPPSLFAVSYAGVAVSQSLLGVNSSLQNVSSQLANWKAPQAQNPGNGSPVIITPDSNAKGGTVMRSGLSYIHAGEKVVPSRTVAFHDNLAPRITNAVSLMRTVAEAPPVTSVINIINAPISPINAVGSSPTVQTTFGSLMPSKSDNRSDSASAFSIPGFFKGTDQVTSSGLAYIHQNERIVPAKAKAFRDRSELNTIENLSGRNESVDMTPIVETGGSTINQAPTINAPATFNFPKGIEKLDASKLEAIFRPMLSKHQRHIERLVERGMENGRLRH
jgi:hypothetical protein